VPNRTVGETGKVRLFLSSFRLDDTWRELPDLVGAGARTAVVLNALDNVPDFPRADWMEAERSALAALGLRAFELDLRTCVGRPDALRSALAGVGLVWVTGGNVFVLREAMRRSGLDAVLLERLRADTVAYGGYSAGACVAGPTLRGIELVDDVGAVSKPIWDGLGLVDFSIAPHYRSAHPDAEPVERVVAYFETRAMPFRAVRDGEAIVVRDGTSELVGSPTS